MANKDPQKAKEYSREYYRKHKQERIENHRKWVKLNSDKIRLYARIYYQKHKKEFKAKIKEYYQKNREKILKRDSEYWYKNKERLREYHKEYREKNKEKLKRKRQQRKGIVNERQKRKRKLNSRLRLDHNFATAICRALRGRKNWRRWQNLIGYTIEDLIKHLESQFDDKMTWDNYGSYWHIDHIKPKSLFKYQNIEDQEFKECWALENLQPMEKITNIIKGNSYVN